MSDPEVFDYYILFPNHHEGLRLYQELKAAGVRCTIAPTPREASRFCGMSLLVTEEWLSSAREVIDKIDVKTNGIARIQRKTGR
ncbi:MAG: DUF3343 domain-containing protein [Firmicutes bacterium]|nr:DUF3343 domain-containing protein [Bacillota bacterium]